MSILLLDLSFSLTRGSSVIHVPCDGNSVANYLAQFTRNIVGSKV
jgi:hypothetical protein